MIFRTRRPMTSSSTQSTVFWRTALIQFPDLSSADSNLKRKLPFMLLFTIKVGPANKLLSLRLVAALCVFVSHDAHFAHAENVVDVAYTTDKYRLAVCLGANHGATFAGGASPEPNIYLQRKCRTPAKEPTRCLSDSGEYQTRLS